MKRLEIDLPEPQELDTVAITKAKLETVSRLGFREVIVEDVALHFAALNGLPGPLVKWFLKSIGARGMYDIAARAGILSAEAVAVIGYLNGAGEIAVFEGRVPGALVEPRGGDGFGWDPIFVPEGSQKSYAELSDSEKSGLSHRGRAISKLKEALSR